MSKIVYWLGDRKVELEGDWEPVEGLPEVMIDGDDNLIAGTSWKDAGCTVAPFLTAELYETLRAGMRRLIRRCVEAAGIATTDEFTLETYHRFADTEEKHAAVVPLIQRGFEMQELPIDPQLVADRISELCGVALVHGPPDDPQKFFARVVRPGSRDNNPPHRDVWLDRLRNAVNIYVPIAGSNDKSSLPLIPGSHLWAENQLRRTSAGAKLGKASYTVPSVVSTDTPFVMTRPNPGPNEVLVFTPYLIHGGAVNFNEDLTRTSLEMRFKRKRA